MAKKPIPEKLTKPQIALLAADIDLFIRGPQVVVARSLEAMGLCTLEDNGEMKIHQGRVDNERWAFELTDAGRAELRKYKCPGCGMVADFPAFDHGEQCGECADVNADAMARGAS